MVVETSKQTEETAPVDLELDVDDLLDTKVAERASDIALEDAGVAAQNLENVFDVDVPTEAPKPFTNILLAMEEDRREEETPPLDTNAIVQQVPGVAYIPEHEDVEPVVAEKPHVETTVTPDTAESKEEAPAVRFEDFAHSVIASIRKRNGDDLPAYADFEALAEQYLEQKFTPEETEMLKRVYVAAGGIVDERATIEASSGGEQEAQQTASESEGSPGVLPSEEAGAVQTTEMVARLDATNGEVVAETAAPSGDIEIAAETAAKGQRTTQEARKDLLKDIALTNYGDAGARIIDDAFDAARKGATDPGEFVGRAATAIADSKQAEVLSRVITQAFTAGADELKARQSGNLTYAEKSSGTTDTAASGPHDENSTPSEGEPQKDAMPAAPAVEHADQESDASRMTEGSVTESASSDVPAEAPETVEGASAEATTEQENITEEDLVKAAEAMTEKEREHVGLGLVGNVARWRERSNAFFEHRILAANKRLQSEAVNAWAHLFHKRSQHFKQELETIIADREKGVESGLLKKISSAGVVGGTAGKLGRAAGEVLGVTAFLPGRWAMFGLTALKQGAEVTDTVSIRNHWSGGAKNVAEAKGVYEKMHLAAEELSAAGKTQDEINTELEAIHATLPQEIQDAYDEAWAIHERAKAMQDGEAGTDGAVGTEAMRAAELARLPDALKQRLEKALEGEGFAGMAQRVIETRLEKLLDKIENAPDDAARQLIIDKNADKLRRYDDLINKCGQVDSVAFWARGVAKGSEYARLGYAAEMGAAAAWRGYQTVMDNIDTIDKAAENVAEKAGEIYDEFFKQSVAWGVESGGSAPGSGAGVLESKMPGEILVVNESVVPSGSEVASGGVVGTGEMEALKELSQEERVEEINVAKTTLKNLVGIYDTQNSKVAFETEKVSAAKERTMRALQNWINEPTTQAGREARLVAVRTMAAETTGMTPATRSALLECAEKGKVLPVTEKVGVPQAQGAESVPKAITVDKETVRETESVVSGREKIAKTAMTRPIGKLGAWGAARDVLREPAMARAFGWEGDGKPSEQWLESKVANLWKDYQARALNNPRLKGELKKLGYTPDREGLLAMMRRVEDGEVKIDPKTKSITLLSRNEYLRAEVPERVSVKSATDNMRRLEQAGDVPVRASGRLSAESLTPEYRERLAAAQKEMAETHFSLLRFTKGETEVWMKSDMTVGHVLLRIPRDFDYGKDVKNLDLPYDGIYGKPEVMRQVKLAEYLREVALSPGAPRGFEDMSVRDALAHLSLSPGSKRFLSDSALYAMFNEGDVGEVPEREAPAAETSKENIEDALSDDKAIENKPENVTDTSKKGDDIHITTKRLGPIEVTTSGGTRIDTGSVEERAVKPSRSQQTVTVPLPPAGSDVRLIDSEQVSGAKFEEASFPRGAGPRTRPEEMRGWTWRNLNETVYNDPLPEAVQDIVEGIRNNVYTYQNFADYHEHQRDVRAASPELEESMRRMFEAIQHGNQREYDAATQKLTSMVHYWKHINRDVPIPGATRPSVRESGRIGRIVSPRMGWEVRFNGRVFYGGETAPRQLPRRMYYGYRRRY